VSDSIQQIPLPRGTFDFFTAIRHCYVLEYSGVQIPCHFSTVTQLLALWTGLKLQAVIILISSLLSLFAFTVYLGIFPLFGLGDNAVIQVILYSIPLILLASESALLLSFPCTDEYPATNRVIGNFILGASLGTCFASVFTVLPLFALHAKLSDPIAKYFLYAQLPDSAVSAISTLQPTFLPTAHFLLIVYSVFLGIPFLILWARKVFN